MRASQLVDWTHGPEFVDVDDCSPVVASGAAPRTPQPLRPRLHGVIMISSDSESLEIRFEQIGHHLDELAARATRAVAELRAQSQTILDDVARWRQQLDVSRVDAELARMDARDELRRARGAWEEREVRIVRRLEQAREDSAAALRSVRVDLERALHDLGDSLDVATRRAP